MPYSRLWPAGNAPPVPHGGAEASAAGVVETALLWLLLVVGTARQIVLYWLDGDLYTINTPILYQAGTLGFNYFDFGAVRRGLGGSVAYLLSDDLLRGTVGFHLLFASLTAAIACWLYRGLEASRLTRCAYLVTLVTIFMRWGLDVGRTDTAVAACLGLATIAMLRNRLVLAVAGVCLGLFVHESSLIFGLPLLAALMWRLGGPRAFPSADRARAVGLLALTLVGYVAMARLPHAERQTMVDVVRAKLPLFKHVDWAIYYAVGGFRGVETSLCQNRTDPSYWTHPVGGLLVLCGAFLACSWRLRKEVPTVMLAALPGFALLCVVANDVARWTMFGCLNLWYLQVATSIREGQPAVRPAMALLCAGLILVAVNPRPAWTVDYPIYSGSALFERIVRRLGGAPTPSVEDALARCDPSWREVLGDPPRVDP